MKNIFTVFLNIFLLLTLVGCNSSELESETEIKEVNEELLKRDFASEAYFDRDELAPELSDEEFKAFISEIPNDKYEVYPTTHNIPLSATLYKDGRAISIDADDERLIRLINFFNNCVYYYKCSYTQGLLSKDYINDNVLGCEFRLELKYSPYGENAPSPYGNCTTKCDMIVITNSTTSSFTLISHDLPGYEGESEDYPFHAVGYYPLYNSYNWLELFGF